MNRYEEIKMKNPDLKLFRVTDREFQDYGNLILEFDPVSFTDTVLMEQERPVQGSQYIPCLPCLDEKEEADRIRSHYGGQMNLQFGLCHGHNEQMQALEWHRSSEFNIAVTDMLLFLGDLRDLEKGRYDSDKLKAFYLEKNQMVEIYGTTLHFCPCEVDGQGFSSIVILPRGTNTALDDEKEKQGFLWARNKWLICHEGNTSLIEKGCWPGIYGENWNVSQLI